MEHANGGELFDYIVRHTRLTEKQAAKFYWELIAGIEYLHKSGVCHRDLKPENLLLDYDNTLKIVDFGLSNMYEKSETLKTACGSPCYAAPEVSKPITLNGLDDRWQTLPRSANRHLEFRCSLLCDGCRIFALRRPQDIELIQENHGSRLSDAEIPVSGVQRLCRKNTKYGPRDSYQNR